MLRQHLSSTAACGVCILTIGFGIAAKAQSPSYFPQSVTPFAVNVTQVGAADPAADVSFQVALKLRDPALLNARIMHGDRLSAAELAEKHLPTQDAYRTVRDWLVGQGLTVSRDTADRLMIEVHGTADTVGHTLGISFSRVSVDGGEFVASAQAPTLPAPIAPLVQSINGLQPYQHMNRLGMPVALRAARDMSQAAAPAVTYNGDFLPGGISRAYQADGFLTQTGAGTRTAILIDALPRNSDLTAFWKLSGIDQVLSNIEFVQVGSTVPAPSGEETLDTEWASSMAPASKVRVYAAGSLQYTALDTALHALMADMQNGIPVQQLSISLGACETAISAGQVSTDNGLFQSLTAQGVSILVSSGDSGAQECGKGNGLHPAFFSTSPYVLAVGGTHLILTASSETSPVKIKSETAWTGSGGGVSSLFAQPSWQSSLPYSGRAVPDVAAVADPATGVVIVLKGQQEEVGGTSAATPIWAGLMALANQGRLDGGIPSLGLLPPRLYPLTKTANLRDITKGSNGGYRASLGYDLTTGLGSPVMSQLFHTLHEQP